MTKAILLATVFVACVVAKDSKSEPSSIRAINNQKYLGSGADRGKVFDDKDLEFTEEENKIIQDVYSPDYYEPNVILDYRYLKSGGRGYVRGDGGQILILPKRNHMPPPQNNYDTLLEYLRLKHLEKISKPYLANMRLREHYRKFVNEDVKNNRQDDLRNSRYYNRKIDLHEIEDEYKSDAEFGQALYKH